MSLQHRLEAWRELWGRYFQTFRYFWSQRRSMDRPRLVAHEAEFLPAALSLQAAPVSPAGRWVARLLMLLVVVLLTWSILGKIDIIVNAQGKIIPGGYTKTIAAVETASVRAIYVQEGQAVQANDVLIELDARASDSDHDKAESIRQNALLQAARSRALVASLDTNRPPHLEPISDVPSARWDEANFHLAAQWRDYVAKRTRLEGDILGYNKTLPLASQRAQDYKILAENHDVAQHAWLEKEQARIDLTRQLDEARNQKAALTAETRKIVLDALNEAQRTLAESTQDAKRAEVHSQLLKLVAPVDGTVQQLVVHTIGGVVAAAQPLMQIVPQNSQVEMEAFIENKDVGFVREGQTAAIKIDAFEYTKYGTIAAIVSHVSRDAIQQGQENNNQNNHDKETNPPKGLVYSVKVLLNNPTLQVDGKEVSLSPGMSGYVEITTGTRRIIEYVLAPLLQHGRESLHER